MGGWVGHGWVSRMVDYLNFDLTAELRVLDSADSEVDKTSVPGVGFGAT